MTKGPSEVWPGKSDARFWRLLVCWHSLAIGRTLKDVSLFWNLKRNIWPAVIQNGLRRLLIEAGEIDALSRVSDEGGSETIAEYLSEKLLGTGKFSCAAKELISSHETRRAAYQSLLPINPDEWGKKYLVRAIKTLELLIFEREALSRSKKKPQLVEAIGMR